MSIPHFFFLGSKPRACWQQTLMLRGGRRRFTTEIIKKTRRPRVKYCSGPQVAGWTRFIYFVRSLLLLRLIFRPFGRPNGSIQSIRTPSKFSFFFSSFLCTGEVLLSVEPLELVIMATHQFFNSLFFLPWMTPFSKVWNFDDGKLLFKKFILDKIYGRTSTHMVGQVIVNIASLFVPQDFVCVHKSGPLSLFFTHTISFLFCLLEQQLVVVVVAGQTMTTSFFFHPHSLNKRRSTWTIF